MIIQTWRRGQAWDCQREWGGRAQGEKQNMQMRPGGQQAEHRREMSTRTRREATLGSEAQDLV